MHSIVILEKLDRPAGTGPIHQWICLKCGIYVNGSLRLWDSTFLKGYFERMECRPTAHDSPQERQIDPGSKLKMPISIVLDNEVRFMDKKTTLRHLMYSCPGCDATLDELTLIGTGISVTKVNQNGGHTCQVHRMRKALG